MNNMKKHYSATRKNKLKQGQIFINGNLLQISEVFKFEERGVWKEPGIKTIPCKMEFTIDNIEVLKMTDYNYENTGKWNPNPYNCPNDPFNQVERDEYFKCPWTDKKCKKKSCYMCKDYGGLQI